MPKPRSSITTCTVESASVQLARTACALGQRRIDSVCQQVDKHLFQLIGIGVERHCRTRVELHCKPLLQQHHSLQQRARAPRAEAAACGNWANSR